MAFVTKIPSSFVQDQSSPFLSDNSTAFAARRTSRTTFEVINGFGTQPFGTSTFGIGETLSTVIQIDGFVSDQSTPFVERN